MKIKRASAKVDQKFTERTVMAMALEMAEMKRSVERSCTLFAALAASYDVPVQFDSVTGN